MNIGDSIIVTTEVDGVEKGKIYRVLDVAYKKSYASEECKKNEYIYVASDIYSTLQIRLSKEQYLKVKK